MRIHLIDGERGAPDLGPPSKICQAKNCGKPVKWQVGITLHPPKRFGRHSVPGQVKLYVCAECGKRITVDDIVSDEEWRAILQSFRAAGLHDPDRRLTEINLLPVLDL